MGKTLDTLLGRGFKTKKFKATVKHAISRLAILRNQHQARCSVARSDVVEILKLGQHERALLRAEQVVMEQNMMDVFIMLEVYCYMLIEEVMLLQDENYCRECPEELKEATYSIIYASTRCGQLPELQELRAIFTSRFGKELEASVIEQKNNCNINPQIIQMLTTGIPSMASKLNVLKEIAQENYIVLETDESDSDHSAETTEEKDSRGDAELNDGEAVQHSQNKPEEFKQNEEEPYFERYLSTSSVGSVDMTLNEESPNEETTIPQGKKVIFDDSDYDNVAEGRLLLFNFQVAYPKCSHTLLTTEILSS